MSPVEKRLGQKVAESRTAAKLTQAELAERVGVATETISRLERGTAVPSLARLEEIATALDLELPELVAFHPRETKRDEAIERLLTTVRRRSAEEIEMLAGIARSIFELFPTSKRRHSS